MHLSSSFHITNLITKLETTKMSHSHSHDNGVNHSHDDPFGGHGHSHDILDGPGSYLNREMPLTEERDWKDRAYTIGIGG